ncbi:MAG: hypothetical protein ACRDD1_00390 [Planctomycetia bacterium]
MSAIQTADLYVAEQIALSMRGLAGNQAVEEVYVFALVVSDDFAGVCKAANTVKHFRGSSGGVECRWQPAEWFATGMEIEIDRLNELLGDPTFQIDPTLEKQRPANQAVWLAVESARLVNPPDLLKTYEAELIEAWAVWESDNESNAVLAAYDAVPVER